MQVSEQVLNIAAVQLVPQRGHQVPTMHDRGRYPFIGRSRTAWQRLLLEHAKHGRPMQRPLLPIVMARRATCLEDTMAARRLGIQFRQWRRRRCRVATGQTCSSSKEKQCMRELHMALFSHHVFISFGDLPFTLWQTPHSPLVIPASQPLQSSAAENLILCMTVRQIDAPSSKEKYAP